MTDARAEAERQYPGWQSEATGRHRTQRKEQEAFMAGAKWQADRVLAAEDQAHDVGYTKGHIDGYREAVAARLSDSLTQLGLNPDERPEHGGPSTAEVLATAALSGLAPVQPDPLRIRVERVVETITDLLNHGAFLASDGQHIRDGLRDLLTETDEKGPWEHEGHKPVQHRDRKPPWCETCGWTSPAPAIPAIQIKEVPRG